MPALRFISSVPTLKGKTAILRVDTDVDLIGDKIVDDTRLRSLLPTLKMLHEKGADVNIIGHLGRPEGEDPKFTLRPIALWLGNELDGKVDSVSIGRLMGWKIGEHTNLVENIRFFPEEEKNDEEFSRELALLGDIYVNDAFAVSHREHASIVGVTKFLPSYAGFHLQKEIEILSKILNNPKRPLASCK